MKVDYPFIIDITQVKEEDAVDIGNKALNLNILLKNNFSIPDGHVIKTSGYKLFLNQNGIDKLIQKSLETINYNNYSSIVEISELIRRKILESPLPEELIKELSINHNLYNNFSFAVRSSATAEDLPTSSFAGQYDTFLNIIGLENITLNIKKCYASLWTERAISYREKNKIPHSSVNLAVLIQKMIEAKSSGVLFTANPITNNYTECLIESNFGLGESLVSGQINPDQYIVQTFIKKGIERFKIISKKIGNKLYATYPKDRQKGGGVNSILLAEHERTEASLSDDIILKLANIGGTVENLFGNKPQDIEWATNSEDQIWLLQTRPITTLENKTEDHDVLWTRGYSDDYWNDPVTPLFFDLLGSHLTNIVNIELNSIMGYTSMNKKLLKLHNGHVYFNLKVLRQKVENEIPSIMRNEDILNYFPTGYGHFGKETIKNLPFRTKSRIIAEIRIMFHDPDGSITKTA
ncbi:MAG: PEP/pyruvate-binding domain-containing protein, partial [Promethearchaeota archaeon]